MRTNLIFCIIFCVRSSKYRKIFKCIFGSTPTIIFTNLNIIFRIIKSFLDVLSIASFLTILSPIQMNIYYNIVVLVHIIYIFPIECTYMHQCILSTSTLLFFVQTIYLQLDFPLSLLLLIMVD